ncbi:hypothetical protein Tco_0593311 [Tanacetum coccineum]
MEKTVNEQLEAEVMTRSSTESKTSLAIAANLSELELKKILIEKMESNKSINQSNEQNNLYKALVEAYESDKLILDTYGDIVSFKRRRDDKDKDEEPSAGSNRGFKRRRDGKEPESTSALKEKTSKTTGKSTNGNLAREEGPRESFDELMDTPLYFSIFMMNRLKIDTLTPKLLADPTFELMKGTCKNLVELEYFFEEVYKATTDQLDWHNPEVVLMQLSSQRPRLQIMVISNGLKIWSPTQSGVKESARDVYSKCRIIVITKLQIVEWHGYKHLDWITVRKLINLNVEDRLAFGVSLRMFTRSIVIQRRVEDLQLGVESYQKKLNITKPDTDGTLDDVQTALNDRLKGIRMEYLPKTIWRQSDRERAKAMIQAIDKQLKSRRIMRSLEKFVGGRPYEGSTCDQEDSIKKSRPGQDFHLKE